MRALIGAAALGLLFSQAAIAQQQIAPNLINEPLLITPFTPGNPLIGSPQGLITQGTRSGTTTLFPTVDSTPIAGNCLVYDSAGGIINAACSPSGSGVVAAGSVGQWGVYTGTTQIAGSWTVSVPATANWYANSGAEIQRLNDQVLIGGATAWSANSGACASTPLDWLSTFECSLTLAPPLSGGLSGAGAFYSLFVLNGVNPSNAGGVAVGAHSFYAANNGTNSIGLSSFEVNDSPTKTTPGYAFYGESHCVGNVGQSCYGIEVDPRTIFTNGIIPSPVQQGIINGYQLGCGAGVTGGQDCDVGIQIVKNPNLFKVGINFISGSIENRSGFGETAIAFGPNMAMQWFNGAALQTTLAGDGSGNLDINLVSGSIVINGNTGVTCNGINVSTFQSALGIVRHC